jgi:hypothetical protein
MPIAAPASETSDVVDRQNIAGPFKRIMVVLDDQILIIGAKRASEMLLGRQIDNEGLYPVI